jgi:hypothetical protein
MHNKPHTAEAKARMSVARQGKPRVNLNLPGGRVQNSYDESAPAAFVIQDMLANIRELNATVDQLKAELAALKAGQASPE